MRAGRSIVVAALLVLTGLLAASEIRERRELSQAGDAEIDLDVAPARARTASALLELERSCSDAAADALRRAGDETDPNALFAALAGVALPENAGLVIEDRSKNVLAWAGATIDDLALAPMPRDSDGTWFVETPASRRLAVRRTRASPKEGVAVLAVCHRPFEVRFPLRNRLLTPSSLEDDVTRDFRVADVSVLPPDAGVGEPVKSAFGGALARVDVKPLSAQSWDEAVKAAAARRRAALVAALALVAAAAMWREVARWSAARAALVRAAIVLATRAALGAFSPAAIVDLGPLSDAERYAHTLPLNLAGSPASLLLTCVALCAAAAQLRRASASVALRPGAAWRGLVAAVLVAVGCRLFLASLIRDVVENSTVEFFDAGAVFPHAAPAALLAALLAAGIAAVFLVESAWRLFPPRERPSTARALFCAVALAAALAPLSTSDAPHATALGVAAVVGFFVAAAAVTLDAATAARAALVPLGVAAGLFAPLEDGLFADVRGAVAREADTRVSRTDAAERMLVARTLRETAEDPRLLDALRAGRVPSDLALRLWADSPLARRTGGSSLEIVPLAGAGERRRFSADLPPATWLPAARPAPDQVTAEPLAGRGSGAEGRWILGSKRVLLDARPAATVEVVLEVRPPDPALPELRVLGPSREFDARELPELASSRYAADGALVQTDDPYRPAGSPLDPDIRRAVIGAGESRWFEASTPDRDLEVLVVPEVDDDGKTTGASAFSYDPGGARTLLLRGTRAALCGALVALVALAATARAWAPRVRIRLAQRLVLSYVLVAALPLSVLGWANREIASERADDTTRRELSVSISLLNSQLHEHDVARDLAELPPVPGPVKDLRSIAYVIGHHANVFRGAQLVASSDQGLFDTELLPTRLPARVYRDVILLGRPFEVAEAAVGDYTFDVGYAPLRGAEEGEVMGAVSVPLLHQRRLRDVELASVVTAVLGLYLASFGAAIAVGTWLARRLTKPLADLTQAASRVAKGDLGEPVPQAGPDELSEVVSAFNRMQADLAESRAKLVRAEKESAWRDMARQVAHEVKNPLTPMRLAAEHVRRAWRDKAPNFDDVLQRAVDLIVRQTESLQRIATAFGDFARFPARRRESVDVAALLDEVLDMHGGAEGIAIRREIERPVPLLAGDPDELRRVLVNLVKNAVEALEGRTGTIAAKLVRQGDALVLTIADDGPGIPDEVLPRLFEPYLSTKTKGTGLGLAICKRAVDELGGTISVESRKDAGTTITVRLPLPAAK